MIDIHKGLKVKRWYEPPCKICGRIECHAAGRTCMAYEQWFRLAWRTVVAEVRARAEEVEDEE